MTKVITEDDVRGALRAVMDPELNASIVDLGMLRDVAITGPDVTVKVDLTIAGCPLRTQLQRDIESKLRGLAGIGAISVEMGAMDQDQRSELMAKARLKAREQAPPTQVPASCRVLAVASGKGGVGKSTTSVNVAAALAAKGHVVGVMDADIWGFSAPRMLGMSGRIGGSEGKMDPLPGPMVPGPGRLEVVSMGFLVDDERQALMWRGLILTRAVEHFLQDVRWSEDLSYLVIDLPPGTGDIQMALSRLLPQAEMLLVTTPQKAAQQVAARAASMARRSYMKVLGVVENMSWFECDHGDRYDLFGSGGGESLAGELGVPLLGQIPLDPATRAGGDTGRPAVLTAPDSPSALAYARLADRVLEALPPVEMAGCTGRMMKLLDQLPGGVGGGAAPTDPERQASPTRSGGKAAGGKAAGPQLDEDPAAV